MRKLLEKIKFEGSKTLWIILLVFLVCALILYISSVFSVVSKINVDVYRSLKSNILYLFIGGLVAYITSRISPKYFNFFAWIGAIVLGIMLALLFFNFGHMSTDGRREFIIQGISFRPAHLMIICLVILTANYFIKKYTPEKKIKFEAGETKIIFPAVWWYFFCLSVVLAMITKNNFSSGAIAFVLTAMVALLGGLYWKHFFQYLAVLFVAGLCYVSVVKICPTCFPTTRYHTWEKRLFGNSEEKSKEIKQIDYAKASIISGEFLGKGPGNSNIKNVYAESHSDFVYATIGEEYGILGGTFVIFLFLVFAHRVTLIFNREQNLIRKLIVIGLGAYILILAIINIGVSVGTFPVTGQPMPFFSLGGSFVLFSGIAFGIILSISAEQERQKILEQSADNQSDIVSEEETSEQILAETQK